MILTAKTRAICADHWHPVARRCVACPIAAECHATVAPLTAEAIAKHAATLNAAAEKARP